MEMAVGSLMSRTFTVRRSALIGSLANTYSGDETIKSEMEQTTKRRLEIAHNPFSEVMAKRIKLETPIESKKNEDVLDFLKSRPQVAARAAQDKSKSHGRKTTELRSGRVPADEAADLLNDNRFVSLPRVFIIR